MLNTSAGLYCREKMCLLLDCAFSRPGLLARRTRAEGLRLLSIRCRCEIFLWKWLEEPGLGCAAGAWRPLPDMSSHLLPPWAPQVALCFSPVGNKLRIRSRRFPAIVSCTAIDWFQEWPREALESVSLRFLRETESVEVSTSPTASGGVPVVLGWSSAGGAGAGCTVLVAAGVTSSLRSVQAMPHPTVASLQRGFAHLYCPPALIQDIWVTVGRGVAGSAVVHPGEWDHA